MAYTSANPGPAAGASGVSLDRALRKLFPSTSKLTFNPLFRWTVNAFDVIPRLVFPEFRTLPPNHLRIRVGVGNRILNNQTHFLVHARDFWMFVFSEGIANMRSDIIDIGVGCGRWAHWLRDYNFRGRQFAGTYVGVDIDEETIEWCRKNYDTPSASASIIRATPACRTIRPPRRRPLIAFRSPTLRSIWCSPTRCSRIFSKSSWKTICASPIGS
jgi:Methyltransferase domain